MRGDVFRLPSRKGIEGHVQSGPRYAVVVQSDNLLSSTIIVAPTTTKSFSAWFHPTITMGKQTVRVLIEQITAVDSTKLGDFAGRLNASEMADVNASLKGVLGLY